MLNKTKIIDSAFLKLGEQNQLYNTNISDKNKIASSLFDEVIDEIAVDSNFTFNSRTILLSLNSQSQNFRGEYRYNIPSDYLNKVRCSDRFLRIENDFFYSFDKDIELTYCFRMNISEYPDYIRKYVTIALAIKLAEAFDTYYEKIPRLERDLALSQNQLMLSEGLPFEVER